jgi:GNAT superfamily N-acetyltransferase
MSLKDIRKLILSAENKLETPEQFVNDFEMAIKMLDREGKDKPSQSYKPSSLNCIRQMYYGMVGSNQTDVEESCNLIRICESGTDAHERIQFVISEMKRLGFECEYLDVGDYIKEYNIPDIKIIKKSGFETKLKHKKLKLRFLCDGLIRYKGELYILEIKTESTYKHGSRIFVAEEHRSQGTAYCSALLLNKVLYLYEDRNSCGHKAYILPVTDEMKHRLVIDKIADCEEYVKNKCLPPKPEKVFASTCKYCDYATLCKENKQ